VGLHTYYLKHKKSFQGDRFGIRAILARTLSSLFSLGVYVKNAAYKLGIFKPQKAPLPVVSIGNIAIGGSGKTPFCICLAKHLEGRASVGIISRGYGGKASKALDRHATLDVCTGHGPHVPAIDCGDEPYLIARTLPQVPFVVGKERLLAARRVKELGADIVFMDDGLQHRRLHRDVEIVLVPQKDPLGKRAFFPRGELRDSVSRVKDADYIIVTSATKKGFEKVKQELQAMGCGPVIGTRAKITEARELNNKPFSLKNKRAVAFAGIAHPKRFIDTLESSGVQIVDFKIFPDHAALRADDLRRLSLEAKHLDAECIVCTEKDAVKLFPEENALVPIVYVAIEHEVVFGKSHFKALINRLACLREGKLQTKPCEIDDKRPAVIG